MWKKSCLNNRTKVFGKVTGLLEKMNEDIAPYSVKFGVREEYAEVPDNLNCIHGALLRMNRSIQSEGANGIIKWDRSYTRARRRDLKALVLEIDRSHFLRF